DDLALVIEYDAYDYENDARARRLGETEREGGLGVGVEYRYGWVRTQLAHQDGEVGLNVSMSAPLEQRTFAKKVAEPRPVTVTANDASYDAWQDDPAALAPVLDSLIEEGLPVVRLLVDGPRVELAIGAGRYSTIG